MGCDVVEHDVPIPAVSSDALGWNGIGAAHYRALVDIEIEMPPADRHLLVLINKSPDECEVCYEDVERHVPAPAGTVAIIPAGVPLRWRCRGQMDLLKVTLEPSLVARVVTETFGLDPAHVVVPSLDRLDLPPLRATMQAVAAELTAGDARGNLAAESLANVLAVHLIRHLSAPNRPARRTDGALPQAKLRAVVEFIEENLAADLALDDLAAVAHVSPYHFARQFRATTGLPPYQFVIARRVERAKQLLQGDGNVCLAQVALQAGFSDQSQLTRHFKRLVGVTPGRFR